MTYEEQLKDERWRWLREQVIERDFGICQHCMSGKDLNVHHRYYEDGKMAWEYPMSALITLCKSCHEAEHVKVGKSPRDPMLKVMAQLHNVLYPFRTIFGKKR